MAWTSPIPSAPAWGTSDSVGNHIGLLSDSLHGADARIGASSVTDISENRFSLSSLLFAPANVPIVLPLGGELEYTGSGGGGSTRPITGMIYPRGQG